MGTHGQPETVAYTDQAENLAAQREQLIMEHLPQVRWIATRFHEKLPDNTCLEDLISIGIIGLINAIDSFDPGFNVKLKTYAEHKIRGAILDSLRGMDGIPPHKRKTFETDASGHGRRWSSACSALRRRGDRGRAGDQPKGISGVAARIARRSASAAWMRLPTKTIRAT